MSNADSAPLRETRLIGLESRQRRIDVRVQAAAVGPHYATNFAGARETGGRDAS